jgi:hypothetical protein
MYIPFDAFNILGMLLHFIRDQHMEYVVKTTEKKKIGIKSFLSFNGKTD